MEIRTETYPKTDNPKTDNPKFAFLRVWVDGINAGDLVVPRAMAKEISARILGYREVVTEEAEPLPETAGLRSDRDQVAALEAFGFRLIELSREYTATADSCNSTGHDRKLGERAGELFDMGFQGLVTARLLAGTGTVEASGGALPPARPPAP